MIALLLSVLPGALWPGSTSYEAAKFLVLSLGISALTLNCGWRIFRGQQLPQPSLPQLGIWLSLPLAVGLSAIMATNTDLVWRTLVLVTAWVYILWLVYSRLRHESHLRWLLRAMVGGTVLTAAYGLAQIQGWLPGPDPALMLPRGISTFGNENQMAGLAAVVLWPALALMFLSRSRLEYRFSVLAILILLAAVLKAEATGPKLAVFGAALVIAPNWLLLRFGRTRIIPWLSLTLFIGGSLAVVLVFTRILAPTESANLPGLIKAWLADNNGYIRRTDWLVAWHLVRDNGWGFSGAGNYQVLWPETRALLTTLPTYSGLAEHIPIATRAHNDYLQALMELGPMSVVVFGGIISYLAYGAKQVWRQIPDGRLARVWLFLAGGVITIGIHGLVSFPFHLPTPTLVLAAIVGAMSAPVFRVDGITLRTIALPRWMFVAPVIAALLVGVLGGREFLGDLHAARGERAYTTSNFPTALAELEQARDLLLWPSMSDLYYGLTLMAAQRDDEAAVALQASLTHRPTYETMLALAEIETDRKDFTAAVVHLDRVDNCQATQKFRDQSQYLRAMVLLRQGDYKAARAGLELLVTEDPHDHRGMLALGYLAILEGNNQRAREDYRQALRVVEEDLKTVKTPGEKLRLEQLRNTAIRAIRSVP